MDVRFSAPDWCFYKGQEGYYRRLREIGIGAVEMVDPSRRADAGMPILNTPCQAPLNRADLREENVAKLAAAIEEAKRDGIAEVIVFSGDEDGISYEDGIAACVATLREAAPLAESAGIVLTFEMFNEFDHAGYHAISSRYGFRVARGVDSPNVRVLYDAYHMARMGEDVLTDLRDNIDLVSHIHLADVDRRSAPKPHGTPPTLAVIQTATEAGYQGWFGLEYIPQGEPLDELAEVVRSLGG